MMEQFLSELRQFLPDERIYTDELRTLGWGTDASFYRQIPKVVVRSDGEEEIAKIVCACRKYKLPFTFRAAGTSLSGQSCTDSVLIVAGKHWEKFELADDKESIRLQPGIVGAQVNQILKPYGRVFPPDPASIGSAMVGGIVVNNASGMNCGVHANSDRMMRSARIVLTDGTILDTGGAETLLGNGDMLYKPGDKNNPERIQGAFLSDNEVEAVVEFLRKNNQQNTDSEVEAAIARQSADGSGEPSGQAAEGSGSDRDEYFEDAGRLIITSGKASIGALQRKFKIGFNRAARIMDELHDLGLVSDGEGTKERQILMTMEEFENVLNGN